MPIDKDDIDKLIFGPDDDWEDAMQGMSDHEMLAHLRGLHHLITTDPESYPGVPPEMLEQISAAADKFERAIRRSEIADQNARIAHAEVDRLSDELLASLPDKKGN